MSNDEKRKKFDLELDKSNQTISYEEYINVVNQRDSLNLKLDNLRKEFNNIKASNDFSQQSYNHNNSNNNINNTQRNSTINNTFNYQNTYQNYNPNTKSTKQKTRYYDVATGKPVSAISYYIYRIKKFFSDLGLLLLALLAFILMLNALFNISLFNI